MSETIKTNLIKYGICAAIVILFAALYIGGKDFAGAERVDQYLILCDAFTVPGVLLTMAGCLVWASTTGVLDGIAYAGRYAIYSLIPGKRLEKDERYGDFLERKQANRAKGYGFLFVSGLITLAIALVFMGLFYSLYQG